MPSLAIPGPAVPKPDLVPDTAAYDFARFNAPALKGGGETRVADIKRARRPPPGHRAMTGM
jgi:hypothetical protein